MKVEERLKNLEDELRLMRSQVRQTLADVRDFLQDLQALPPRKVEPPEIEDLEDSVKPSAASVPESVRQKTGPGPQGPLPGQGKPASGPESVAGLGEEGQLARTPERASPDELELAPPEGEAPEQLLKRLLNDAVGEAGGALPPVPQVNLLANLIRWVSAARKEIGGEQLPTFLDVYNIAGQLSSEVREIILQLAEVLAQYPTEPSTADIWSRLLLELHGILSGGGVPLHPPRQRREELEKAQEVKALEEHSQPLKLKIVLPIGEKGEREFSLNLMPEDERESK